MLSPSIPQAADSNLYLITAWKVTKYRVISDPYFPVFRLNTQIYKVNLRIHSEYRKIRTRNNPVSERFSHSARGYMQKFAKKAFYWIRNSMHAWRKTGENHIWCLTPVPIHSYPGLLYKNRKVFIGIFNFCADNFHNILMNYLNFAMSNPAPFDWHSQIMTNKTVSVCKPGNL